MKSVNVMPYLFCKKCKGYYELNEGESLEDFERCECGGELIFSENKDEDINLNPENQLSDIEGHVSEQDQNNSHLYSGDIDNKFASKSDVELPSSTSQRFFKNSAFILLTFTIFPILLGFQYSLISFYLCAAYGVIVAVLLYNTKRSNGLVTVAEFKKYLWLCGLYFLAILGSFLLWASSDIGGFLFNFLYNFPVIMFTIVFSIIFLQRYLGNINGDEVVDPLDSLDNKLKYIYYIGVLLSIVWLVYLLFFASYFNNTSTTPI